MPYAAEMGFTHLELLPVSEHPFDASWGYQTTGLFAPTRALRRAGGLRAVRRRGARGRGSACCSTGCRRTSRPTRMACAKFDGTALYEHADPRQGFHPDWNTAIYNFGRREVLSFLARQRALLGSSATTSTDCASTRSASMLVPRLLPQGRRVDPQRRTAGDENRRSHRLPAGERTTRSTASHAGVMHRGGIDRLAGRVARPT
jgi:hypothetical protein